MTSAPRFAPELAHAVVYVALIATGHAVRGLVAGRSADDRLHERRGPLIAEA
jgi:hypothetical protein